MHMASTPGAAPAGTATSGPESMAPPTPNRPTTSQAITSTPTGMPPNMTTPVTDLQRRHSFQFHANPQYHHQPPPPPDQLATPGPTGSPKRTFQQAFTRGGGGGFQSSPPEPQPANGLYFTQSPHTVPAFSPVHSSQAQARTPTSAVFSTPHQQRFMDSPLAARVGSTSGSHVQGPPYVMMPSPYMPEYSPQQHAHHHHHHHHMVPMERRASVPAQAMQQFVYPDTPQQFAYPAGATTPVQRPSSNGVGVGYVPFLNSHTHHHNLPPQAQAQPPPQPQPQQAQSARPGSGSPGLSTTPTTYATSQQTQGSASIAKASATAAALAVAAGANSSTGNRRKSRAVSRQGKSTDKTITPPPVPVPVPVPAYEEPDLESQDTAVAVSTPSPPRTPPPPQQRTPARNAQDGTGADLLLFLATSPSPATPHVSLHKTTTRVAPTSTPANNAGTSSNLGSDDGPHTPSQSSTFNFNEYLNIFTPSPRKPGPSSSATKSMAGGTGLSPGFFPDTFTGVSGATPVAAGDLKESLLKRNANANANASARHHRRFPSGDMFMESALLYQSRMGGGRPEGSTVGERTDSASTEEDEREDRGITGALLGSQTE